MTTTTPFKLGSISTGTLKTEDLIERFTAALVGLEVDVGDPYSYFGDGYHKPWEQHASQVLDAIMDALNELCPPFVYFGASADQGFDDGKVDDFGFWPDWDSLNELPDGTDVHKTVFYVDDYKCIVQFHQWDKITVRDMERNIIWTTEAS